MGSRRLRPMTAADLASMPEPCAGCAFWESTLSDLAAPADHTDRRVIKADWAEAVTQRWGYCGVVACAEDEPIGFLTMAPAMRSPSTVLSWRPASQNPIAAVTTNSTAATK